MLQNELNRAALLDAAKEIIGSFNPAKSHDRDLFQRGLQLYRNGAVYNVVSEYGTIEANVSDEGAAAYVFIDLERPTEHTCTCLHESYCEHVIATLLYCSAVSGGIGDIMNIWKEKERLGNALVHVRKASSLLKQAAPREENIKDWYEYFHKRYEEMTAGTHHTVYQIFYIFYQRMMVERPKEKELGNLFCVNALLFSVEKLANVKKHDYSYSSYMIRQRIQELIEELEAIPTTNQIDEQYLNFIMATKNQVVRLLSTDDDYFDLMYTIYQLAWSYHLHRDSLIKEHIQSIETSLEKGVRGEQLHYELAHLYFLQENDEGTMEQLKKVESFDIRIILAWTMEAAEYEQWNRVVNWLSFCHHLLKREMDDGNGYSLQHVIHTYLRIYQQYLYELETEGYEQSLQTFLPYSFYAYCDYLLEQDDYRGWAELHMLTGRDPFLNKDTVKLIEQQQRSVLIPLYHHYIEKHIQEKNRKSYKIAVRYLKKLRAIYKKEKKVELWEQYVEVLVKSYSRLRALQEELRKGKIII